MLYGRHWNIRTITIPSSRIFWEEPKDQVKIPTESVHCDVLLARQLYALVHNQVSYDANISVLQRYSEQGAAL